MRVGIASTDDEIPTSVNTCCSLRGARAAPARRPGDIHWTHGKDRGVRSSKLGVHERRCVPG